MNFRVTHKRLISALLIALYAFMVTPTQWWHRHEAILGGSSTFIVKKSGHPASLENATGINCKICSHHYSIFDQDSSILELTTPSFLVDKSNQLRPTAFIQPLRSATGRAPPTLIG